MVSSLKSLEPVVCGALVLIITNLDCMPQQRIVLRACGLCVITLTTVCVSLWISNIICFQQVVRSQVCPVMSNGRITYSRELLAHLHNSYARFGCYHNKFFWSRKGKHFTMYKTWWDWGSHNDKFEDGRLI